MTIAVRRATAKDLDWLVTELRDFSAFYGTKKPLFGDLEYIKSATLDLIKTHLVMIAERESGQQIERVGFIAGYVTPHPFNPGIKLLSEAFWWVPEQFRGSRAGLMLLNAFTTWGKSNVDWITMTVEHKSPVNTACLKRRGYLPQEQSFLLEVG